MRKQVVVLFLFGLIWASTAQATLFPYSAVLSGAAENPANASAGTGTALVVYDSAAHTLQVDVIFSGLTGTTTASHIHCCVLPPGNVGVATQTPTFIGFPLGVTSGTYSHAFDLTDTSSFNAAFVTAHGGTAAGAEAFLAAGLEGGQAYLNIHTSVYPSGEIRGFLTPEPGTAGLLGGALALLLFRRRKQSS